MSKITAVRDSHDRYMTFGLFMELVEGQVGRAVQALPVRDLAAERSLIIARLLPSLTIRPPNIAWSTADHNCVDVGRNRWRHSLIVSVDDPSHTLWSIEWPFRDQSEAHFSAELDSGMLIAVESISAECREGSHQIFTNAVEGFKTNLLRAQMEFDRFNAALPYLISASIEYVLDCPQTTDDS